MNTQPSSTPVPLSLSQALQAELAAEAAARQRLADATAALERARTTEREATAEAVRRADEERAWVERHSNRLKAWIEAGSRGSPPVLTADAKAAQAQHSARAMAAAAASVLGAFEEAEAAAREELAAVSQRITNLRGELRRRECDHIAERLRTLRAEERTLATRLAVLDSDSSGALLTPRGLEALGSPPARPSPAMVFGGFILDDVQTPRGGDPEGIEAARRFWSDFDAQHLERAA